MQIGIEGVVNPLSEISLSHSVVHVAASSELRWNNVWQRRYRTLLLLVPSPIIIDIIIIIIIITF